MKVTQLELMLWVGSDHLINQDIDVLEGESDLGPSSINWISSVRENLLLGIVQLECTAWVLGLDGAAD